MNQSEWTDKFISNLSNYHDLILDNSCPNTLPKYIIQPQTFFPRYNDMIMNSLSSYNTTPILDKIDYSEYRLVSLISCLNEAKEKYELHSNSKHEWPQSKSSQLIRVNNIIKDSFELTSFIYLMDWLQRIYKKEKAFNSEKIEFNNLPNGFHPDQFNQSNNGIDPTSKTQYEQLISEVNFYIRKGDLAKGQEAAEYKTQFFLSSVLEGGLPQNDFAIDSQQLISSIDFDLFPPYMKNKEFNELKNGLQGKNSLNDVYGNQNWTLWLSCLYESSDDSNDTSPLYKLSSFLSGCSSSMNNYQESIDDLLYKNILQLFNSYLIENYINEKQGINYYYSTEGNEKKIIESRKGKSICDILSAIRTTEAFKHMTNIDYTIEIEFDLMQLHFLAQQPSRRTEYYQLLYTFLTKIVDSCIKGNQLSQLLLSNYKEMNNYLQKHQSYEDNTRTRQDNLDLMKANYFKMLFIMLISFFGTNCDMINEDSQTNQDLISIIDAIYTLFDDIIIYFFNLLLQITIEPTLLVYISSFMLHLNKSQEIIALLANQLNTDQDKYQRLMNEIELHFSANKEEINTFLANKTSIFSFGSCLKTIDVILEEHVNDRLNYNAVQISGDDTSKIAQLKMLLDENKMNKEIIMKYILLLSFKFLANNKFNEVFLMINETFSRIYSDETNTKSIDLFILELEQYYTMNDYADNIQEMLIRSSIRLITQIIHCFFAYGVIIEETKKKFIGNNGMNNNISKSSIIPTDDITNSFYSLNHLLQLLVTNKLMTAFFCEFFGEKEYEEVFKKLVNNWVYQTIKWTTDIFTNDIFLQKNIVTEIPNSLFQMTNLLMYNDMMMLNYFVLQKPYSINDNLHLFEREELFHQFLTPANQQEILKCLYKLASRNHFYLKEVMDTKTCNALQKDIDTLDF